MGKYSKSFENGQVAADSAAAANAEIDKIFREMADDLFQATNGRLEITINNHKNLIAFINYVSSNQTAIAPSQDSWICGRNPAVADSVPVMLAGFRRPYEGYPCVIEFGNSKERCNDALALETALNALLQNAWVASELRKIVDTPDTKET